MLLRLCNAVNKENAIEKEKKSSFHKKGDLGISKNYRGITLTAIDSKVYNTLLLNNIKIEIEKILNGNQNSLRRYRSTTSMILTMFLLIESVSTKHS